LPLFSGNCWRYLNDKEYRYDFSWRDISRQSAHLWNSQSPERWATSTQIRASYWLRHVTRMSKERLSIRILFVAPSGARRKFSWGVSFSGRWWSFVFGVRCLWRNNLTTYSCIQAKFVDIIVICFYTHSPYFCKKSSPIHSPYNKIFCKISSSRGVQPQPPLAYALSCTYGDGAQTFWLVGHICLSETLRGPQELIISIKIL